MDFLHVEGKYIVDESEEKVFLRGVNLGGWLNMENFITGYIGTEREVRLNIKKVLGEKRAQVFFNSLLDNFITEEDFKFLSEIGATVVRIPFNYRHFEDDMNPGQFNSEGFHYLDKAVEWGRKYGIYIILDLHAAPGWQNRGWHSDNPYGIVLLWKDKNYQKRVKQLWGYIAEHYKNEPTVAGYDLINEPETLNDIEMLEKFYKELIDIIRTVDKKHIIFIEGDRYSTVFEGLKSLNDSNLAYSPHDYIPATWRASVYPGFTCGEYVNKDWQEERFLKKYKQLLELEKPCWIGEFGVKFDGDVYSKVNVNTARLMAIKDQLDIFNKYELHWTLWTYKAIVQGLVISKPECLYIKRLNPILALKKKLGLDFGTARGRSILVPELAKITELIASTVGEEVNDYSLDYATFFKEIRDYSIYGKIGDLLAPLYAFQFVDMTEEEIRQMFYEAFNFSNCIVRSDYLEIIKYALNKGR